MIAFLSAPQNVAFVSAIVLMLLIGLVQLVGLGGDWGVDAAADADTPDLLAWLGVGTLPLMVLLVVFLAVFGLVGLIGQQLHQDLTGGLLSGWVAAALAAAAAFPLTGVAARGLAKVLPRDHTTAIDVEELVGRFARIVVGRAAPGSPARARAEDAHGLAHFVMVEPDMPDQSFEEGETVLLVRRHGDHFRAISRGDHHLPRLD